VWGRRSVFRSRGKSLLVSEIFLPALFAEQAQG
jgi:chorismate-pyruvate lyase